MGARRPVPGDWWVGAGDETNATRGAGSRCRRGRAGFVVPCSAARWPPRLRQLLLAGPEGRRLRAPHRPGQHRRRVHLR